VATQLATIRFKVVTALLTNDLSGYIRFFAIFGGIVAKAGPELFPGFMAADQMRAFRLRFATARRARGFAIGGWSFGMLTRGYYLPPLPGLSIRLAVFAKLKRHEPTGGVQEDGK
jgi:hypothetical protein